MEPEYRCLICGEKYGSHVTAIHKLFRFFNFVKKRKVEGETNDGFDENESLLIENN